FEREREQIALNYQSAVDEINRRSEDFRKKVDEDTKKGLISPEVARRKKLIAAYLFGQLLDQAEMARLNAQVDAAFKQFQKTLETAKKGFDSQLVAESEETTRQVREQVGKFLEGQITFEQYQKNLTAILKHEAATRRRIQLEEAEEALRLVKEQLKNTTDADQIKRLEAQRDALRQQISTLRREIATGAANEQNDEDKERIDKLLAYAKAIQDLAMSVINFWNQVNAAEAASLDRSIALQNRRVENARELAEKGN